MVDKVNDNINKPPARRRPPAGRGGSRPENPSLDALAGSFGFWLFQVHRRMHAMFLSRLAPWGVNGAQWALLAGLEAGPKSPAATASRLGVDRAAVSRLIDQLEEKRLVRRVADPADRRAKLVGLTTKGRQLVPKLKLVSARTNREFLELLEPTQAAMLAELMRLLGERAAANKDLRLE